MDASLYCKISSGLSFRSDYMNLLTIFGQWGWGFGCMQDNYSVCLPANTDQPSEINESTSIHSLTNLVNELVTRWGAEKK